MKKLKVLFNPFEQYSEKKLIVFGIVLFIIGSLLACFFNSRFDSFLHLTAVKSISIWEPFIDNLIIFFCLFLFLFPIGKYLNPKTRSADILAIVLVGNAPFYVMAFCNVNNINLKATNDVIPLLSNPNHTIPIQSIIILIITGIVSIIILIWVIALFYNGFKTATNAKSTKAVVLFIIALLAAKILNFFIPHFLIY